MNGKIVYINNTLNDLAPSIPKFKFTLYNDKYINKTYAIMYTQNNKYVQELCYDFFEKSLERIKSIFTLPYDPNLAMYYGDEVYIDIEDEHGKKIKWFNIKSDECIVTQPLYKLNKFGQELYETNTKTLFAIMMELFRNKLPETFYKKY